MSFSTLPTELRLHILSYFLADFSVPHDHAGGRPLPPGFNFDLIICPTQTRPHPLLKLLFGMMIKFQKPIRLSQNFWGSRRMSSLFCVSAQMREDLMALIYERGYFMLPLTHARELGMPLWVKNLTPSIASSIQHLDVTFELRRYDAKRRDTVLDPVKAMSDECWMVRKRFPCLKSISCRTFQNFRSVACYTGVSPKAWDLGDRLDPILEAFQGIPLIRLCVCDEHACRAQQHGVGINSETTWLRFTLVDGMYRDDEGNVAESPVSLVNKDALRAKHAHVMLPLGYPMWKENGEWNYLRR